MFLLPIGHSETSVRRLPWITFGVMGICLAALILSGASTSGGEDEIYRAFEEAFEYYLEHPYLELDEEFQELAAAETGEELSQVLDTFGGDLAPPDRALLAEQQAELDRLTARVTESLGAHPYMRFGLIPAKLGIVGLLTHMFMHAGWLHLLGNMLILYLVGPYVEDVWGRPLYAGFYLLSGVAAALGFVAMHPTLEVPLVGASGAVAGVMGAFLIRYWSSRIRFFYVFGLLVRGTFWAPAWLMLPLWLGQQLFMAMLTSGMADQAGVAYWAHVVGFLFGAGVAWGIKSKRVEERYLHAAIEATVTETVVDNRVIDRALDMHASGRGEAALAMLSAEARAHPSNRDVVIALWSLAVELELPQEAGPAMLRLIQEELKSGDREDALAHWKELSERVPRQKISPAACARIGGALAAANDRPQAAVMLRRALLEGGTSLPPATALQIARVGRTVDPTTATTALRIGLARPDLDPESREQLETLLRELSPAPVSVA